MSEVLRRLKERAEKNQSSKKRLSKKQSLRPFLNFLLERQRRRLNFMEKLLIHQRTPQARYDISIDYSAYDQTRMSERRRRRLGYIA